LLVDKVANKDEALIEIYQTFRPGEPANFEAAKAFSTFVL
jgi:hypothetical protein